VADFSVSLRFYSVDEEGQRNSGTRTQEKAQSGAVSDFQFVGVSMPVTSRSNPAAVLSLLAKVATVPLRSPSHVRFGPFELDPKAGELCFGEIKVVLPDQPHTILLMLVERSGKVVTRDEIQKRLWPDVIVDFEHGINAAIRNLRRALGDSADDPKYIETVGRRGYRLRVPVEVVEETVQLNSTPVSNDPLLQIARGQFPTAYSDEELRAMAAVLIKLLQLLAGLDRRPLYETGRDRCRLNSRLAQLRG
jgi:DNA-binding winged helix-turn-helix (wHTH) protein